MALTLTERLIRDRVNLNHENLEDIKSLSLPGTFHEKIVSIGTSLRKFSRLKSLDLSRNALETLQGLDHLQLLEKLNLYYNNVSSLDELKRLRDNPNLRDLDLRLNPVTRNEPDYRLYLIHMLPNLQTLDDRGVRDRERQAALTHFSSCQAAEMTPPAPTPPSPSKAPLPRTEMMNKLMKGPSVLVDDDVAVIDMVNRNQGDLSKPRPLTGSAAKENKAEDYTLDHLKLLDQPNKKRYQEQVCRGQAYVLTMKEASDLDVDDPKLAEYKERYPNILAGPIDSRQIIGDSVRPDPNLQFPDEIDAGSRYRGQGYFTPNPDTPDDAKKEDGEGQTDFLMTGKREKSEFMNGRQQGYKAVERKPKEPPKEAPSPQSHQRSQDQEKVLLHSLLNLVDRYWNGSKSLHKHQKFIEQALKCVFDYHKADMGKEDVENLKQQVSRLEDENTALKRLRSADKVQHETASLSEVELKRALKRAREDVERLHDELKEYVKDNMSLQRQLERCACAVKKQKGHNADAASESTVSTSHGMLDELQRQNQALSQELEQMRVKVKQYSQLQELASMLQESHKSLVETNEHLLREMKEIKSKHHHEIEQMHWSYEQLKSTMMLKDLSHFGMHADSDTSTNTNNHNNNNHNNHYHHRNDFANADLDVEEKPSVSLY